MNPTDTVSIWNKKSIFDFKFQNSLKIPLYFHNFIFSFHWFEKSLVTFGANVNLLNDHGESVRHIATSTKRSQTAIIINALHQVGSERWITFNN